MSRDFQYKSKNFCPNIYKRYDKASHFANFFVSIYTSVK